MARHTLVALAVATVLAVATTAATVNRTVLVEPTTSVEPMTLEPPRYGPILSDDPAVVREIRSLYDAEREALDAIDRQTNGLRDELKTIDDPEERRALQRLGAQLRRDAARARVEFGLEIARLNRDDRRVAEFERALEFHLHPERFRPEPVHVVRDPSER